MQLQHQGLPNYLFDPATFVERFDPNNWGLQTPDISAWKGLVNNGILWNFLMSDTGIASMFGVGLIALMALVLRSSSRNKGGKEMRYHQRQAELKKTISDILVDVVEDARYRELISASEKKALYKRFAQAFEDPDLLATSKKQKRAVIRARNAGLKKITPKIPGDAPPQIAMKVANKPTARKYSMLSSSMAAGKTA